jgi:hypothetical protein
MEDPVLEGLAVELGSGAQLATPSQSIDDARVGEIELGCPDYPSLRAFSIGRKPSAEKGVFQNLEMALGRLTLSPTRRRAESDFACTWTSIHHDEFK